MSFRSIETLQGWVDQFQQLNPSAQNAIRVIPQDGFDGADTGLVAVRMMNSPTEIYLEPPTGPGEQWIITFEPREEYVRLQSSQVRHMAAAVTELADLCVFMQQKADDFR